MEILPKVTIVFNLSPMGDTLAMVNDQQVQLPVPARLVDGVAIGPIRFLAEQLGNKVSWNETEQEVEIVLPDGSEVDLQIGSNFLEYFPFNDHEGQVKLPAPVTLVGNVAVGPLREIAELLNAQVGYQQYDDDRSAVIITLGGGL